MTRITRIWLGVITASALLIHAAAPVGWFLAGSKPASYDTGVDSQTIYNDKPSAYLKSKLAPIEGFGTLMQDFKAEEYLGKRIRFSAFVKSENVQDWAGLWMRIDKASGGSSGNKTLGFDNMQDRPIKGTTAWQDCEIVLDVAQGATGIAFGILLSGTGEVWLNSAKIEVVPTTIPTTGHTITDTPQNLDFQK